ncbi:glucosamine-6-phosphate deaminase [Paenalcaligenes hominis]|uniref:glucosamine-6-phosphate deaminase n=1 Tax=Paenalcaligenes hominis TaxID=643674 RepID=UPI003523A13E
MMFYRFTSPQAIADYVTAEWVALIQRNPKAVLGLATGSTMEPIYDEFVRQARQQQLNLDQLSTFNLDEYIGLGAEHPQSYHYYMQQELFGLVPFNPKRVHLPDGLCDSLDEQCAHYHDLIQQLGGIDWQLLGIGTNGHIGFNEPGTSFDSQVHVVDLSPQTRLDNSRFFADKSQMPTQAITLGLGDIMQAKQILLLATGENKAQIMAELYHSGVDESLPASILKKHSNVRILVDEAAAQHLPAAAFNTDLAV